MGERAILVRKYINMCFILDFVHFSQTESLDTASPLFSMLEFLNIRLNDRRLKSRKVENKELTDAAF
jgi:hypothetical protein